MKYLCKLSIVDNAKLCLLALLTALQLNAARADGDVLNPAKSAGYEYFELASDNFKKIVLLPSFHDHTSVSLPSVLRSAISSLIGTSGGVCLEAPAKGRDSGNGAANISSENNILKYLSISEVRDSYGKLGLPESVYDDFIRLATPMEFQQRLVSMVTRVEMVGSQESLDIFIKREANRMSVNLEYLETEKEILDSIIESFGEREAWRGSLLASIKFSKCDKCIAQYSEILGQLARDIVDGKGVENTQKNFEIAIVMSGQEFLLKTVLGDRRNRRLAQRITEMSSSRRCGVFVVGASHFGSSTSVENVLSKMGFKAKKLHIPSVVE
jgi:hypothetical protein